MKIDKKHAKSTHLTGKGGLGLVVFHLARRQIEFAMTPENSPLGDIWVSVAGLKFGIEVKTCREGMKWQVDKSQIKNVDFYVLVSMDRAQCFIMMAEEMLIAVDNSPVIYGNVYMVSKRHVPDMSMNDWGKIDGRNINGHRDPALTRIRGPGKPYRHKRTVRKTLSDGTIKVYTYEPRGIAAHDVTD